MHRSLIPLSALSAGVVAGLTLHSPLAANAGIAIPGVGNEQFASASNADDAMTPVELVKFDYRRFFTRPMQLGVLNHRFSYTLTVGADGEPSDCELSVDYRNTFTTREICRQIRKVTKFRPAVDSQGNPVEGSYSGEVQIAGIFYTER